MKVIDITEKLNFEEKPQIKIKDTVLTVNNEAVAFLKILPKMQNDGITSESIDDICKALFEPSEIEKIEKLKLDIHDFMTVITSAVQLVTGEQKSGEMLTHTTT